MSALESLTEVFGEGGHGDSSERYALELLAGHRAELLRAEASNLRKVVREEIPEGALGTRTGMLKAALLLDERADLNTGMARPAVSLPGRFDATPAEIDRHLRRILAEDVYLRYQQTIGGLAVVEAAKDQRMDAADKQLTAPVTADVVRATADLVDPLKGGGPYPSRLLCSQHGGFGPCPGAPRCTPRETLEDNT